MDEILPANNNVVGRLIGNYKSGHVTTLYGNAASGKTTCCFLAMLEAAKNRKVIYIDTESGFDPKRIRQLHGDDVNSLLDNVFLIQPKSFKEQYDIVLKTKKLCRNKAIKLVVVDTIGHHYRTVLNDYPQETNRMMAEQMANLIRIARDLNKIVLVTNPVYAKMDSDGIKMVGGRFIEKLSGTIIELYKTDDSRFAACKKYKTNHENTTYYNLDKRVEFEIREEGLVIV